MHTQIKGRHIYHIYIYINIKLLHLERYINLIDYEIVKIIQRINDDYKM